MNDILVTGSSGFIGKHAIQRLRADGYRIFPVNSGDGDIADKVTWHAFPVASVVLHLASRTFVPGSWDRPSDYVRTNLLGVVEALEFCRKHSARLIFLSSYLYGEVATQPISESAEISVMNPYALSKKLAEDACRFYSEHFGVLVTILRPFNVYGPDQPSQFLVPHIVSQVRAGGVIQVKDLEPKRDYVYVKDLVDAIVNAIRSDTGSGVFNIGTGVSYSVGQLIATIQDICGTSLDVLSAGQRRSGEIMNTIADIGAASRDIGWAPRFTLRDGLADMLNRQ